MVCSICLLGNFRGVQDIITREKKAFTDVANFVEEYNSVQHLVMYRLLFLINMYLMTIGFQLITLNLEFYSLSSIFIIFEKINYSIYICLFYIYKISLLFGSLIAVCDPLVFNFASTYISLKVTACKKVCKLIKNTRSNEYQSYYIRLLIKKHHETKK